jgi:hypothetical protein
MARRSLLLAFFEHRAEIVVAHIAIVFASKLRLLAAFDPRV